MVAGRFCALLVITNRRLTLSDVCGLVQHQGVSAADALAAYYAGRTGMELADALKECGRTGAFWEEHNRADQVPNNRARLGIITAETERRQLAATRGEALA